MLIQVEENGITHFITESSSKTELINSVQLLSEKLKKKEKEISKLEVCLSQSDD